MVDFGILDAKIYHERFFPRSNKFTYKSYYLILPVDKIAKLDNLKILGLNKFNLMSFYESDHYPGKDLNKWIRNLLSKYKINITGGQVVLMAMPRVVGYVFNPVSFWFCLDKNNHLSAVLAEVRNTFGESHNYLCYKSNYGEIKKNDLLEGEKVFHVSPFIKRDGKYQFRFEFTKDKIGVWIKHYNPDDKLLLSTSVVGKLKELNDYNLLRACLKYPFITLKTIFLIHYQALKLYFKGVKYIKKPKQKKLKLSLIKNINKDDK